MNRLASGLTHKFQEDENDQTETYLRGEFDDVSYKLRELFAKYKAEILSM